MTGWTDPQIEDLEVELLLEAIYRRRGFDFRNYARGSLRRRIRGAVKAQGVKSVSALQERILHNPTAMDELLRSISVSVSAMFRDPSFFRIFREHVVPRLRTYPLIRIWSAACCTGEEPFSLAILLEEEGLYDRCRIYATDLNDQSVRSAREGIFPEEEMEDYEQNYVLAGGKQRFSDYYTAAYERVMMKPSLSRNIIFARHNLASDASFNEFQVILCRNVMIYFNLELQKRVHNLLYDSLCPFGILGLGDKESVRFTPHENDYRRVSETTKLFQRIR